MAANFATAHAHARAMGMRAVALDANAWRRVATGQRARIGRWGERPWSAPLPGIRGGTCSGRRRPRLPSPHRRAGHELAALWRLNIGIRYVKDECGATAIEYGLIAALFAVGMIAAARGLGSRITGTF